LSPLKKLIFKSAVFNGVGVSYAVF
jgi:hypothetical protein